jgi:hypothetical protein
LKNYGLHQAWTLTRSIAKIHSFCCYWGCKCDSGLYIMSACFPPHSKSR